MSTVAAIHSGAAAFTRSVTFAPAATPHWRALGTASPFGIQRHGLIFSLPAIIAPAWIVLGAIGVLFTRKFLWVYLLICLSLAALSWQSGATQVREQREQTNREKELKEGQQQLNQEFAQLAVFFKMPPDSSHETILAHMHAMESVKTGDSGTAVAVPPTAEKKSK